MKIIVSSGALSRALNAIDGPVDCITTSGSGNDTLVKFNAGEQCSTIHCIAGSVKPYIDQRMRMWDEVLRLVNSIPDQPITIEVTEGSVNVTFSF